MTKATRIADSEALTSLFRASLDALPDALLILRDGETSFAFANRAAASLLRTSAEALLLLGPDDVLKAGQFRRNDALSSTGDDGTHWPRAWRARRRDGSLVPVLVNTSRIPETKATLMRLEPQTAHRTSRSADHVAQHGGDQHDRFALLATAKIGRAHV